MTSIISAGSSSGLKREAFEKEALRWTADLHRFALSMTRDEADAEDVVQDTYLRALRSWRTFAPESDCRRWLFTICRNVFLRSRERSNRCVAFESRELDTIIADGSMKTWEELPPKDFATVDVWPAIQGAVAQIPEPFRSTIIAVDLNDESYETAAARLGVPIGTVRSRLFRGRRLLQRELRSYALDFGVAVESNILRVRGSMA
ncbi:MAG: sigma-70 family RNA polymerase sigma factor [Gemmatimonadaceae bacterium]